MSRRRVHVLYEYGPDLRPHGSAFIRLLRPLTHPKVGASLEVSFGREYEGQAVDAVIVDRLWRPDISLALAQDLVKNVRRAGARLIYALDDNLLDLAPDRMPHAALAGARSVEEQLRVVRLLLREADGILVTTQTLQQRLADLNQNIIVLHHALDERLLVAQGVYKMKSPFGRRRKVVGYMGTFTHDDDLIMILPALRDTLDRYRHEMEFQIVGVTANEDTLLALDRLPVRVVSPRPEEIEYPLFMLWFTSRIRWDIAISPLRDTSFNRCKSDIKLLDYSAVGAAGIYSRVPAYESSVHHLQTGWLADNSTGAWIEALEELLCNDELRMRLAQNAAQYLYARRVLACRALDWPTALEDLLETADSDSA